MRYIRGSAIVRAKLLSTATINFFNFVFWALFILYATRELGVRPGVLGLVLGAGAIGGVLGSVVTGRLSRRFGVGPAFVPGCVLFPVPLVLVPLAGGGDWPFFACLFLAEFVSGFGVMLLDISAAAIKAALVPDRLRARVSGAYMVVNYGVRPLGALAGGAARHLDRPAADALDRQPVGRDRRRRSGCCPRRPASLADLAASLPVRPWNDQ